MKSLQSMLLGIALCAATAATAQNVQFLPVLSYRVGPYAAGGSGYFGGAIDYWTLVNMSGGVNGVKLIWEECETEYNAYRNGSGGWVSATEVTEEQDTHVLKGSKPPQPVEVVKLVEVDDC